MEGEKCQHERKTTSSVGLPSIGRIAVHPAKIMTRLENHSVQ